MNHVIGIIIRIMVVGGLLGASASLAGAPTLSPDEKAYLTQISPIQVCVDPDWYPYEQINNKGKYVGIGAELLHRVMTQLEVDYHIVSTANWEESISLSQQGSCDVMSFLNQTPKRRGWLNFTHPMLTDANVFITRDEHLYITDPLQLRHERLVLPVGTSIQQYIRNTYPNITILNVQTEAEAFDMVVNRQAEMTIRSLIIATYAIDKKGLASLKIAGQVPGVENQFRMGVNTSKPLLRDILNKAILTITDEERNIIVSKHLTITTPPLVQTNIMIFVATIFGLGLLVLLWRYIELARYKRQLKTFSETDVLTGLLNRKMINREFHMEVENAFRDHHDLSVMMIDVDFFKRINDTYGHQAGDDAIRSIADVLQETLRRGDKIGRWGGEEFLVLCPETNVDQALWIADRLRENVHDFFLAKEMNITLSVGVAGLLPNDSNRQFIKRADDALVAAKNLGHNKTNVAYENRN